MTMKKDKSAVIYHNLNWSFTADLSDLQDPEKLMRNEFNKTSTTRY